MRKYLLTLVGCTLWTLLSMAAPRTVQEAAEIASRFTSLHQPIRAKQSSAMGQQMRLAYTQAQTDHTPALYVFNTEKADGGFVIVSADDNTRAILGYADNGTFSEENMPANMRFWLQMYADEIARAAEMPATTAQTTENIIYPIVSPLLGTTVWGQDAPFYNMCPTLSGVQCVTGCVATAASQIMYHHRYPIRGTGSHSYTWKTGSQTLSADFGNTTYDWANMLPDYSGNNYTMAQANAVATLMSHTGIACDMEYNTSANGGSATISHKMMTALIRHFDYDTGIRVLPKDYMDENEMLNLIAQDLQAGHPIFMSGHTTNNEGHAFVCDGMQSNGYIHINWGWDGYYNGHFAISAMNSYGQGTGGAASGQGFTEGVSAFTGIQPNRNGMAIPCITADDISYSGTNPHLHKTKNVTFTISKFTNNGVTSLSGKYAYLIYKDSVLYATISTQNTISTLEPGHFFLNNPRTYTSLSSLSAGNYELSVGVIPNSSTTAYPILTKTARGEKRIPITVTADSVFIGENVHITKDTADLEFSFAFIYDETDLWAMNFLQVELQTANYHLKNGKATQGTSLKLGLIPADRTSIIGTYLLGNGINAGTLYADYGTTLNYGNNGTAYSDKFRAGVVTVTVDKDGNYVFDMELVGNKRTYVATCSLNEDNRLIATHNQAAGDYDDYSFQNKVIAALSVSQAKSRIKTLSNDEVTKVPYLVRGIVSQTENTHIASSGAGQFYISDDGKTTNQLYCFDAQWLDNEPFITGSEIALTDTVVMLSSLHNHPTYYAESYKGHVYYHARGKGNPTPIESIANDPFLYVVDIMGRVINNGWQAECGVPQAGVYIVRSGDKTTKVIVP